MKPIYEKVRGRLYKLVGHCHAGVFTRYNGVSFVRRALPKKAHQLPQHTPPQVASSVPSMPIAAAETSLPVSTPVVIACTRCGWSTTRCTCPPERLSALDRAVSKRLAQVQAEQRAATAAGFPAYPGVVGMGGRP